MNPEVTVHRPKDRNSFFFLKKAGNGEDKALSSSNIDLAKLQLTTKANRGK